MKRLERCCEALMYRVAVHTELQSRPCRRWTAQQRSSTEAIEVATLPTSV